MILAGDVGGTKCNLALFSEENGTLTCVFRKRFASKEFAQFDLIVKEFSRLAAPHLASDPVVAAGFGVAGPVIDNYVRARICRGLSMRERFRRNWMCRRLC